MNDSRLERFKDVLRCPYCRGTLIFRQQSAQCDGCEANFPIFRDIPLLMTQTSKVLSEEKLSSSDGKNMVEEYSRSQVDDGAPTPSLLSRFIALIKPPDIMLDYLDHTENHPLKGIWGDGGKTHLALNVGGGPHRESNSPNEITMNIKPFFNVDLVGDGHNIPAADDSFDTVLSMSVLEHVDDPVKVAQEMFRVLKPGGQLYVEVPFILFYHGYPSDFTRWTSDGLKKLFPDLEEVQTGMTKGPVSAMLQSINGVLIILIPSNLVILRKIVSGIYRWVFFLFKYVDLLVRDNPSAHIMAGGFYIIGRKPVVSD
ncbi:MAG: methyltransferase domain-containing protein [Gammaproteobacteria bacterium]|nr:methyltransferase domain-containing protein [Pseudomonadales bacterium]